MTGTTTFRLSDHNKRRLDRLAEEMICSRTDVLQLGMAALRRDPELRKQIRADNIARAFLKSLRTQYGDNAVLELADGSDDNWKLANEPIDREIVDVAIRRVGDHFVMDLLDPSSGVGISNVSSWTDDDGARHVVVPLNQLWVYSANDVVGEPKTRQLHDGRTVVQISEDDGTVKHVVLDNAGNSRILDPGEVSTAAFNK